MFADSDDDGRCHQLRQRQAPQQRASIIPLVANHDKRQYRQQPEQVFLAGMQGIHPFRTVHGNGGQGTAQQHAGGTGVKAEEYFVKLLAIGDPVGTPHKHQRNQQQHRAPHLLASHAAQQQRQERWPNQVEVLFDRQRPHVQQGVGAVKKSDAVVRQVQRRHHHVLVHIVQIRPNERRKQPVRSQKQEQRRHQAQKAALVKAPVIQPARSMQFLEQQRCDQKAAENKKQVYTEERAIKHGHVCMGQKDQNNRHCAQAIQRRVVFQLQSRQNPLTPFNRGKNNPLPRAQPLRYPCNACRQGRPNADWSL